MLGVHSHRPVNVMGRLPTVDDVRAVTEADFKGAPGLWKLTAPKKSCVKVKYLASKIMISETII